MTTENQFSCVFCTNTSFSNKEELQAHFRLHGDPKFPRNIEDSPDDIDITTSIPCDVCPKVFEDPAAIITHKRKCHPETYEKIFCSWCGKFFTLKVLFDRHILEHDTTVEPEEVFNCDICDKDFYNFSAMTYHNKFYHRQNFEVPEIGISKAFKRVDKSLVKIYFCPHCGEESINKVNLNKHITDNHEEATVDSTLRCPLCLAVFYSLDAYEMHLTFHSITDVYISKKKSYRSKLSEFTLETLPPKIEKVGEEPPNKKQTSSVVKEMLLALEDNELNIPVLEYVPKKHKKSKKKSKPAITLDEFLNMNTDIFGEGLNFQGVEEIPTQVVTKQLKREKPNAATTQNIQKLKALGINVKKKTKRKPIVLENINTQVKPNSPKVENVPETNSMLIKLLNQSTGLQIVKKGKKDVTKTNDMDFDMIDSNTENAEKSTSDVEDSYTDSTPKDINADCKKVDESASENCSVKVKIESIKEEPDAIYEDKPFDKCNESEEINTDSSKEDIKTENAIDQPDLQTHLGFTMVKIENPIVKTTENNTESGSDENDEEMSFEKEKDPLSEEEHDQSQNLYTKTKLLLNSQITLKASNITKPSMAEKSSPKDMSADKRSSLNNSPIPNILTNRQITVKTPKIMTTMNDTNVKSENESDENSSDESENQNNAWSNNSDENSDHEVNTELLQYQPENPKMKLLSNSQITLKATPNIKRTSNETDTKSISVQNNKLEKANSDNDVKKQNIPKEAKRVDTIKHINEKPIIKNEISNCPKNKLLQNSQITIKSGLVKNMNSPSASDTEMQSNRSGLLKNEIKCESPNINAQNSSDEDEDYEEIINKRMLNNKKQMLNKNINMPTGSVKNSPNNMLVPANYFDSDDSDQNLNDNDDINDFHDDINDSEDEMVGNQPAFTINKVKTTQEKSFQSKNQNLLNNTQLTVKQINTKSSFNKTINSNNQVKMTMFNQQSSSVKKVENRALNNQKTIISDRQQTKVSCSSAQSKVTVAAKPTLTNFKGIKIKHKDMQQPTSDDDVEYIEDSSEEEGVNEKPTVPNTTTNALSNIQNKLGQGITIKNLNTKDAEEEDDNSESEDEAKEPLEIGSIVHEKKNILNKLKNNNLGLSIKPMKQNAGNTSSDLDQSEASTSKTNAPQSPKPQPEKVTPKRENEAFNNKPLTVVPYKPPANKISKSIEVKNVPQNKGNEIIKQESSSNQGETVTQAVTVKQYKTETVIEEVTTTVTKTIRKVVNEEHSATTQKSFTDNNQPSTSTMNRPVKISKQLQHTFVKPANLGPIRQMAPRTPRGPRPVQAHVQPRPVFRQPSPRGPRPIRPQNPNRMTRPTMPTQCTYRPVKIASNINTNQAQRPKMAVEKVQQMSAQSFKSQVVTKNVGGNSTKSVQRSMMASSQMKSEFSAAGTSQKISMSSVNTKSVQKFESNVQNKNSSSLIEKLQQQGLLVKKPRLDVEENSDEETMDFDEDE